ncbi:MAG: acylphosphatase [Deltaproteobacteria bacterium]|nr:acylphosphatase [Deltaproteobacteria bacterium]
MDKVSEKARVHLIIEGRVQGVFFRATAAAEANRLGVKGWVRNCPDGAVEVLAEGERKRLDDLIAWCRHGPPGAHVHNVTLRWENCRGEFRDFRISR